MKSMVNRRIYNSVRKQVSIADDIVKVYCTSVGTRHFVNLEIGTQTRQIVFDSALAAHDFASRMNTYTKLRTL